MVTSVAWSDDGHLVATGDDAGAVVVWDVVADSLVHPSTARAYSPLQGSTAAIQHVAFFERDGATVVEGLAVDGSYVVWDVATGEAITVGDAPAVALTAAARADDGGAVAGAVDTDGDGDADLVRTYKDGHVVAEAEVAGESVDHLHFRPGGKALVWSEGEAVHVWDLAGPPALAIEVETPVSSVGFSADGALLAVGEFEGAIWLVDLADADRPSWEVEPRPTSPPIAVAFAPGGSMAEGYMLASAHLNGQVQVSGTLDRVAWAEDTLLGHKEVATALAFGAAGQIVSASYDGEVLWWSAAPFVGVGEAVPGGGDRHESDVTSVGFLDEETVVSLDAAGAVILTDRQRVPAPASRSRAPTAA